MGSVDLSATPVVLQDGTFDAIDVRRAVGFGRIEGVDDGGDFAVTEDSGGASMDMEIAAGMAFVRGDTVADQGLYLVRETATQTVTLTTADGSNPRIDRMVLRVYDNEHDGSGATKATIETVDGTPSAGATLTNLTGAAAVPSGALLLANILVDTSDTTITDANIDTTLGSVRAYSVGPNDVWAAGMYAANSGSPTHDSASAWQKVGSGGGTLTWTSDFDVSPSGFGAQVDTATNKRLDIVMDGIYHISGTVGISNVTDGLQMGAAVHVDGTAVAKCLPGDNGGSSSGLVPAVRIMALTVGQYLELYAYQQAASSAYVVSDDSTTRLEVVRLGPSS